MPDEELRSLVRAELSEIARPCYDAELTRRGLSAAPPRRAMQPVVVAAEPDEIAPEPEEVPEEAVEEREEEDLAPAAIFSSRAEANAAKALLQSAAIPAFLEDDTLAGGGFRLLVAASDVAKAGEVREAARHSHE
ncbi:MAG: DUF2007 domain-containing protein [Bryobacteraceae bacterium]|jgi:hypothetical protein